MDDLISRQAAIDSVRAGALSTATLYGRTEEGETARKEIERTIKALPSVNPQANREDIHREREQAYMRGYEDGSRKYRTEQSEDAISRQAAIGIIQNWLNFEGYSWGERNVMKCAISELMDLPPVSTEKTGQWEWVQYDSNPSIGNWHCSECNRIVCGAITAESPVYSYKYCPNCGARMREVGESE